MTSNGAQVIVQENHFQAVKDAVSGDVLKKAAMAGGQVIEAYAKSNVNSTFSNKATGGAGLGGSIQTVLISVDEKHAEVAVGPTMIYGRIHELGGVIRPVAAKALHFVVDGVHVVTQLVHIPARPYLRPAVDEHQDEIQQAIGFQLKSKIEEVLS